MRPSASRRAVLRETPAAGANARANARRMPGRDATGSMLRSWPMEIPPAAVGASDTLKACPEGTLKACPEA
jgi:hypothetical protein